MANLALPFHLHVPRLPSSCGALRQNGSSFVFPQVRRSAAVIAKSSPSSSSSTSSAAAPPKVSSRGSGLKKPLDISPGLQQFLGLQKASRADTMKLVWDYIKSHDLQNPDDRRRIVCDEKLKSLLGKDECNFLELAKLLNPHFLKSS